MKVFTCPFEPRRCGLNPRVQVPVTGATKTIQSRGFNRNDVCYYWIEAMQNVSSGDFVYVKFTSMSKVETFVSLKTSIEDEDVTCKVTSGDTIVIRHPMKLYLSFVSEGLDAKFFINTYYSPTQTGEKYANEKACSDEGASLGDMQNSTGSFDSSSA